MIVLYLANFILSTEIQPKAELSILPSEDLKKLVWPRVTEVDIGDYKGSSLDGFTNWMPGEPRPLQGTHLDCGAFLEANLHQRVAVQERSCFLRSSMRGVCEKAKGESLLIQPKCTGCFKQSVKSKSPAMLSCSSLE